MHRKLTLLLCLMIMGFFILNSCDMILKYPEEVIGPEEKAAEEISEEVVVEDEEVVEEVVEEETVFENGEMNETYEIIVVDDLAAARSELWDVVNDMDDDIQEYLGKSYELEGEIDETEGEPNSEDYLDEVQSTLREAADELEPYYGYVNSISNDEEYTTYYYDIIGMQEMLVEYIAVLDVDFASIEEIIDLLQTDSDSDGVSDYYDVCSSGDDNIDTDQDDIPDACDTTLSCTTSSDCDDGNSSTYDNCTNSQCVFTAIVEEPDECTIDSDCDDGNSSTNDTCVSNECVFTPISHCSNSVQDEDESDVDCGGSECDPCEDFKACSSETDCENNFCYNNVCEYECDDGDDGGLDMYTASTATGYLLDTDEFGTYEESCTELGKLIEYDCWNNRIRTYTYSCPTGYSCTNGECILLPD